MVKIAVATQQSTPRTYRIHIMRGKSYRSVARYDTADQYDVKFRHLQLVSLLTETCEEINDALMHHARWAGDAFMHHARSTGDAFMHHQEAKG